MPLVVTCAQCRREVLEADRLGDEEQCASAITSGRPPQHAAHRDTLSVCFYRNLGASAQLPASHRLHTSMLIQSSSRVHGTGTRNMTACAVRWHSGGAPDGPRCEKVHSRVRLATPDALGIVPERCTPKL